MVEALVMPLTEDRVEVIARQVLESTLNRLGYSIVLPDDMRRLAEDLRWVAERRAEEAEMRVAETNRTRNAVAILAAGVTAGLGVLGTVLTQWLSSHLGGGSR